MNLSRRDAFRIGVLGMAPNEKRRIQYTSGAPERGELFVIDGGDGDQTFFSEPQFLRLTEAPWFPGRVGKHGEAMLCAVEGGAFAGRHVALTARHTIGMKQQIASAGWAGAVVHLIHNPTESFLGDGRDSDAIGMTFVTRHRDWMAHQQVKD